MPRMWIDLVFIIDKDSTLFQLGLDTCRGPDNNGGSADRLLRKLLDSVDWARDEDDRFPPDMSLLEPVNLAYRNEPPLSDACCEWSLAMPVSRLEPRILVSARLLVSAELYTSSLGQQLAQHQHASSRTYFVG